MSTEATAAAFQVLFMHIDNIKAQINQDKMVLGFADGIAYDTKKSNKMAVLVEEASKKLIADRIVFNEDQVKAFEDIRDELYDLQDEATSDA